MPKLLITRKSQEMAKQYSVARCEELLREDPRGVERLIEVALGVPRRWKRVKKIKVVVMEVVIDD